MISYIRNGVLVMIAAHCLRVHWRKCPVLTRCKHRIRRSSSGHSLHEELRITPRIVAVNVEPEGKIQIQHGSRVPCSLPQMPHLVLDKPLDVEVVLVVVSVKISLVNITVPKPFGPGAPSAATL